ncbi:unknown protein [Simkania negevensis Z]|uniref:Uncharacterized protein n=1 Tax=Simkania negevensis (strain ATCC VR-1471 / DSM 27360 / Z) TaxID=331113 RepID=F8L6E1_SIMNZ|nr:unknown protein [Simkania negevensis Z]
MKKSISFLFKNPAIISNRTVINTFLSKASFLSTTLTFLIYTCQID